MFPCAATTVQAQMFSVKPQRQTIELPGMVFSAGLERMSVVRSGGLTPLPYTDLGFSSDLLRLQLETGGLMVSYSAGRGLGPANTDYTSFELALVSGIPVIRRDAALVSLPIFIYSVNTTMTSNAAQIANVDFRQNALGLRTGLQADVRLGARARISAFGTAGYAFSANGFSSNGGNATQWDAGARLFVDGLVRSVGLTTGVVMQERKYDLDNRFFNYDMSSVSFLLGVTF